MDEISELLTKWGLPHLADHFREQRVTKSVLLRMREDQMVVLSQFLGDQVILWDEICKENAASSGTSGASQSVLATTSASSASQSVPAATSASSASQSVPATTSASSAPSKRKLSQASSSGLGVNAANKKIASVSNLRFAEEFDLHYFLENDSVGEIILDALNKEDEGPENFFLSEKQRDCLVQILVKHIKDNTINFEYKLLQKFAEKIESLFPTESANTFYCPPKTEGSHQTTAKGKLFNKLKNTKSSNKSLASCGSNPTPQNIRQDTSSGLQAILDQSITEESLGAETWLASNRSPWTKVLEKWALTAPLRFKYLFNTEDTFANTYIDRWPVLAHKSGFELLTADFDLLYPGKGDSLFVRWPSFASRTISLAKKDIRDETGKKLLALYLNCEESNTRGQNATLISLLSSIRPSHRRPEVGKVSSLSSRESYILHLTSALELRNTIKKHRTEKLANVSGGGQPLIIVIGPTITKVNKIYVSISELLYEVPCVLSALDICFKSFFSLHMRYPPESGHVWLTLQRVLYKFSTEWDVKGDLKQSWIDFYKF